MIRQTVEKDFKWEMAHRLVGLTQEEGDIHAVLVYKGNCRNLHGHSYHASIQIELLDYQGHKGLDEFGMVFDYNVMKEMKDWIDANLDHAIMVSSFDAPLLKFVKEQTGRDKHFEIEESATAENIAKLLYKQAGKMFNDDRVRVCSVKVRETDSSEARYGE
jgi:6-pyruvoyltetrahydropterin/6-carboxytetrahydropterin synthase